MDTKLCRLCSYRLPQEPLLRLPNTPIANQFLKTEQLQGVLPLALTSCNNCHHYQLNYSAEPEELFNDEYVFVTGTSAVNVKYFQEYAKSVVEKFNLQPGDFVFEIGANDGTLLKAFKKLGMKVLGVDPAVHIAKEAGKGKSGVEVIGAFFTEELAEVLLKEHGPAKLVVANNVLAHLDNVIDIVKGVKLLLGKDGIFVFENSYFKDMYTANLPDLIYHEHMSHFLVYPLMRMFQANDLCLFDVINTPVHGGSIRGFVSVDHRPYSENVEKLSQEEKTLGLLSMPEKAIKMTGWAKRIGELRQDLAGRLNGYKAEGKKIAAYGAPAKFTTLSYILDLSKDVIDYVVDSNPLKQGTYSPGKHIPVFAPTKLWEDKPDVIIITAWNFAESIIAKNPDFNGTWIIPLPKIRELARMPVKGRRAVELREINKK